MLPADIEAVVAAERRICPFPWTRGNFTDSLLSGYGAWLAREGDMSSALGEILAYAVTMRALDEAHLLNIGVVPERQRGGLGSALLTYLFDTARAGGAMRMFLEVRRSNANGRAFYLRHGFTAIGERRGYYPAPAGREDAIVMACDL